MIERTLVLLKPDAVQRGLSGEIIARFEKAGLKIVGSKMVWVDDAFAKRHYREEDIAKRHGEKIWKHLLQFITEGPVLAFVLEGIEAVHVVRKIAGPTEPKEAAPGTIRGDYAHHSYGLADSKNMAIRNLIHASATKDEAVDEVAVWFSDAELHTYKRTDESDHYGN